MNLRGVDTNLIVPLRALLHERHVTRAARAVGLGQSTMSHALARLRAHFHDPLLVPVGRSFVLTERARALIAPVNLACAQLERVFADERPFDPATSERRFRILGTDNLELYLLPRLAALLAREAPRLLVHFHHLQSDWVTDLQGGDADLKLGRAYEIPAGLHSEVLFEERLVCVVRKKHPLVRKRLTMEQYAAFGHVAVAPTLGLGESFSSFVDAILDKHRLKRRIAVTVSHFLVAPFVVATSDLLLTASERLARTFERSLELRILQPPVPLAGYKLSQVWAESSHADPGHAWLRGAVMRVLSR